MISLRKMIAKHINLIILNLNHMKTILASLLLIGFAHVSYAQVDIAYTENTNLTTMKGLERNYARPTSLPHNEALSLAEKSERLQMQVFNYDIKTADVYSPEVNTTYTVNFTEGNNHIDAIYAKDGKLIQSEGVFENVPVPYNIGYELAKTYPGWEFHKSWCYNTINPEGSSEISYKIQLKKGRKTKLVKFNSQQ